MSWALACLFAASALWAFLTNVVAFYLAYLIYHLRREREQLRQTVETMGSNLAFFQESHRENSNIRYTLATLNNDRRLLEDLLEEAIDENRWLKKVLDFFDCSHVLRQPRNSDWWDVVECPRPPKSWRG